MLMTSHLRMNGFQIKGLLPEKLAAAPNSPVDGQEYFDTALNVERQRIAGVWVNFIMSTDSRLSDGRAPIGNAGGSLTGIYPNPSLATASVDLSNLATSLKDGTASSYQVRQLGTGAQQAAAGNDSRFFDARTPTGAASGDLAGSYPSPTVGEGKINLLKVGANIIPTGGSNGGSISGVAAAGDLALRGIGYLNGFALPGIAKLNEIAANNPANGPLGMNGQRITSLGYPSATDDAATKSYVDSVVQGLQGKSSVKAATTGDINLSGTQVIDGYSASVGDRILAKQQSTGGNNGIWIVQNGSWTRAADADVYNELIAAYVFVELGSTQADTGWLQAATIGSFSDPQTWTQFSSAGTILAGTALFKTGNTLNVSYDGASITVNGSNALQITAGGVSTAKIADSAVISTKLGDGSVDLSGAKVTGTTPITKGGTGATTAVVARSNLSAAGSAQSNAPALTADTWATVYHGLNVTYPGVTVWEVASGEVVEMDVKYVDANNIQIRSGASAAAAAYTVRVVG